MRRTITVTVTALVALLSLLAPQIAGANRADDPRSERDAVRSEQADVASQLDVLNADQADVEAALADLNANVAGAESQLGEAERAVTAAEELAARTAEEADAAQRELDAARQAMAEYAVDAYMRPEGDDEIGAMLGSDDISEAAEREALNRYRAGDEADAADQLRAAEAELEEAEEAAEQAAADAEVRRAEADAALDEVTAARDQQQQVADEVAQRIDQNLARSVQLASQDRELSAEIAFEEARLQALLVEAEAAEQAEAQAAAGDRSRDDGDAATDEPAEDDSGGADDGSSAEDDAAAAGEVPPESPSAPPAPPATSTPAGGGLCSAGGITVSCQISGQLASMLSAASADGVSLGGSGYRDPSRQISLRAQNCGGSHYAIYEMSASSCSPPTARPGSSMHEVGLAVDFSNCSSRGSACYQWLAGNAASFGFYNLPSEPWHWSINGN